MVFAIHWHGSAMGVHVSPILNPLPPPSPSHPSGSSQCTSPEYHVSQIEPGLAIYFTYGNIHVSVAGRFLTWANREVPVFVFLFSFVSRYFLISFLISSLVLWCSRVCCLISKYLWTFQLSLLLISSFSPLWSEKILGINSITFNLLRLIWFSNM